MMCARPIVMFDDDDDVEGNGFSVEELGGVLYTHSITTLSHRRASLMPGFERGSI